MNVRTRIAPSPTGFAHIGTIYQALFDYAWAKRNNGKFIIRIEDTDRTRFVEGAESAIYDAFDWLGLTEDESPRKGGDYPPYRQSEKLEIYKNYAQKLISDGNAYWCDCDKERLEKMRDEQIKNKIPPMYDGHCRDKNLTKGLVIRMKIPKNEKIIVNELVRGELVFDSNTVDDQVLLKSDGFPTYHLAVVVDDHEMQITHIIRGEEWITSSPKHVLLYQYLGWEVPILIHTPIIRNPDKSKMSKRHGHASVSWYKDAGYLPEAILNYLALLGWKNPDQKDVFSLAEFIQKFDPKDLNTVGPIFDLVKLEWLSGEYIRKMDESSLESEIMNFCKDKNLDRSLVRKTIPLIRERIKKLSDYFPLCKFFFESTFQNEFNNEQKQWAKTTRNELGKLLETDWKADKIGEVMIKLCDEMKVKRSDYFMMMRIAITGEKISPPLNESMEILGQTRCLERLT